MSGPAAAPDDIGALATLRESPLAVRAMLLGVLVNRLGGFLQTFLVLFLTQRGFSAVQAGVALGCYGAGSLVGVLVGGALADRLGPRLATLLSMTGSAGLLLVVLYLRSFPALTVAVGLVGVAAQLYRPASATLLSALTPRRRQVMVFALYRLALNVGTTAAPLLGAALVLVSYDLLFWAEAVAALGYAAIAAITLPRRPAEPPGGAGPGGADDPTGTDGPPRSDTPDGAAGGRPGVGDDRSRRAGYLAVLGDRRYVLYLLAMLVNATVYVQYISTLPLVMKGRGLPTGWYAAVVALNGFVVVTCELLATRVTQRQPVRRVIAVGFVLLGTGLSIYALPWGVGVFLVGTLVWTLAEIVGGPTMFAYPGMVAPEALRGRYIGAMQTVFSLGGAIGPPLGVAALRVVGTDLWWWCGIACLLGMVLALSGMRTPEPTPTVDPSPATTESR